jgi:hypothetical protein
LLGFCGHIVDTQPMNKGKCVILSLFILLPKPN